ncbi:rhodanese-like domain-containing protein [Flavitalea sp. BT771]|uniref:MBL fold metallo-hydrolase n=1 Tax=Flavitalea sp. BT771 TaxID=3063329 RepID=UPI0026E288E8|nr:MBL fold metallo-hydrolase [Flavitalea sp. BT771]MDO6434238.1 rhodanese-like domain-containing protein [Flavitalea sp. BT771]MDV6223138.1 rhodanese-like domain-containing protein [Flavitalea sp. BT771]
MFIKQLYTGCLSEAAYYIDSEGEAAIIDPLRDIDAYLQLAKERKATIKYIFETHFHADFVSGHLDLSKATGAPIVYGPRTETEFPIHLAKDGEVFRLGGITLEVMHTPGHTIESTCYLVRTAEGSPHAVFTGDTLFVGDVGRPDLSSGNLSKEDLAGMLYDSLRSKILPLPNDVIVYPAHGPGSSCGKNLGPNTYSTIADEKEGNYALKEQTKEAFIKAVTEGLDAPPSYFHINARINKEGYESLDDVLEAGLSPLDLQAFQQLVKDEEAIVLDTRKSAVFVDGFIPGAISIGLDGRFAEWAGSLLPFDKTILLVTAPGEEKESVVRLARVGFSKMKGYLDGGYSAWQQAGLPIDMIIDVEADELAMDIPFDENLLVVDVRRETEFADGHVKGALNLPLNDLVDPGSMANLDEHFNIYLHCGGGYRSIIAASLIKRQGIHNIRNVTGGWAKIKDQKGIEIEKENSVLN